MWEEAALRGRSGNQTGCQPPLQATMRQPPCDTAPPAYSQARAASFGGTAALTVHEGVGLPRQIVRLGQLRGDAAVVGAVGHRRRHRGCREAREEAQQAQAQGEPGGAGLKHAGANGSAGGRASQAGSGGSKELTRDVAHGRHGRHQQARGAVLLAHKARHGLRQARKEGGAWGWAWDAKAVQHWGCVQRRSSSGHGSKRLKPSSPWLRPQTCLPARASSGSS